jgi:hypothetical protein
MELELIYILAVIGLTITVVTKYGNYKSLAMRLAGVLAPAIVALCAAWLHNIFLAIVFLLLLTLRLTTEPYISPEVQ